MDKVDFTSETPRRFSFLGGSLALDYCNTVDWHSSPEPTDRLFHYGDLIAWGAEAATISNEEAISLAGAADARPKEAECAFREGIELRETLFRLFTAAAHESAPHSEDVTRFNDWWTRTQRMLELKHDSSGYRWAWRADEANVPIDLFQPIYPVVLAATELLLSPKLNDVRRCEGPPGCGWLFLDHTKNHSRRWCSMRDCGNRAKMRRFQEKKKNNRGIEG